MRGATRTSSSSTPDFGSGLRSQAGLQSSAQRGATGPPGTAPQTMLAPGSAWPAPAAPSGASAPRTARPPAAAGAAGSSTALAPQQQRAAGTQRGWPNAGGAQPAGTSSFRSDKSTREGYLEGVDLKEAQTDLSVAAMNFIRYAQDHAAKLLLLLGVICLEITTVKAFSAGLQAMGSEQFHLISFFSYRLSWLSFYAVAVLVVVAAVFALLVAALAGLAGWTELRPLLRISCLLAVVLGFLVLLLALLTWQYHSRSRSDVFRATNLICNMPNRAMEIYGCPNANVTFDDRRTQTPSPSLDYAKLRPCREPEQPELGGEPAAAAAAQGGARRRLQAEDEAEEEIAEASLGGEAEPPGRRLWALESAAAYLTSLDKKDDITGTSEVCLQIQKICNRLPAGLNVDTSCMCSGQYEALVSFQHGPNLFDAAAYLGGVANDVAGSVTGGGGGGAPQGQRRLYEATGPFGGTQGAYCAPWGGQKRPNWCFVRPQSYCPGYRRYTCVTSNGIVKHTSQGPCTDAIESRSEYALEGLETLSSLATATKMLGILLLGVAACSVVLDMNPSQETDFMPLTQAGKPSDSERQAVPEGFEVRVCMPRSEEDELDFKFEEAQHEAVRKLRESTPIDQRRRLYALYHQANEGDVQGERPKIFQTEERRKYDEWAKLRGMSREEAIDKYVEEVKLVD